MLVSSVSSVQKYGYTKSCLRQSSNAVQKPIYFQAAKGRALGAGLGAAIALCFGCPPLGIAVAAYMAHKVSKWEDEEIAEKAKNEKK